MKSVLYLSSGFYSKNGTTLSDLNNKGVQTPLINQVGAYYFNVLPFEKVINLDDFTAAYWANDTEQQHPIYYKEYSNIYKFDLKGMKISPLAIEPTSTYHYGGAGTKIVEGTAFNVGLGVLDTGKYSNKSAKNIYIGSGTAHETFPEYYGVRLAYTYIDNNYYPRLVDTIDTCVAQYEPIKTTIENYFTNVGSVEGIRGIYNDVQDTVQLPGIITHTTQSIEDVNNIVVYASDGKTKVAKIGQTIDFETSYVEELGYYNYQFVKSGIVPRFSFKTKNNNWSNYYYIPRFDLWNGRLEYNTSIVGARTPPIFLKDKSGNYWMMTISPITGYSSYNEEALSTSTAQKVVSLINMKDYPNFVYTTSTNYVDDTRPSTFLIDEMDGDIDYLRTLLDNMFNVTPDADYDDDGPDAYGPGDPYEDENNAGEAVGGDANIVDDITHPDMSPNTSYENYVIENGLYGSYKLTTTNLRNYTKTLQRCRDNAWIPGDLGDKFENMGNLIQENTVSVFMLPVDIEDISPVPFNVGTKAIRNTDIVSNWDEPSSVDTTSLIKKYTKEYVYDLGTISHYYDNFLDFAPYSTASLYIPYIGKVEIPINLVQSTSTDQKQLSLSIRLNRTNGDILCILLSNNIPLCRWQGNCARSIALSVNDNSAILQNQFSRLVSSFSYGLGALGAAATGNVGGATSNLGQMFAAPMASGAPITTSSHMIGNAPETGDVGWMDSQLITLTVERPIWWKPYDYGDLIGYPTRKIAKLSTVSGFAKVPNIHIRCSATESEKERLKAMLAEGVLF